MSFQCTVPDWNYSVMNDLLLSPQTYCSYPHQYLSYTHPNAVIPSNLSPINPTSTNQASVSTPVNGGAVPPPTAAAARRTQQQQPVQANHQIQTAQSPLHYQQPCSPQIIPSPETMSTMNSNDTQVLDCGFNQVPFHSTSCFQLSSGMSELRNEPCTPDNTQQGMHYRVSKHAFNCYSLIS